MKKRLIIIFSLMLCIISTGCNLKKQRQNVNVYSVDEGVLQGKYVCQNGNLLAYIDGKNILLSKDGDEAKIIAELNGVDFISVNSKYVFYSELSDVYVLDNENVYKEENSSFLEEVGNNKNNMIMESCSTKVFNINGDDVYVYKGSREELEVWEIGTGELVEEGGFEDSDGFVVNKEKNIYLYNYDRNNIEFLYDGKILNLNFEGLELSYKETDGDKEKIYFKDFQIHEKKGMASSASHVALDDNKIYVLIQKSQPAYKEVNQPADEIKANYLAVYDLDDKTSKILYSTRKNDPSEQICGFSARKNQLFLLDNGKLYVADLEGNNKKEIADVSKYNSLNFEYAADKLWIYDEKKNIIMTY